MLLCNTMRHRGYTDFFGKSRSTLGNADGEDTVGAVCGDSVCPDRQGEFDTPRDPTDCILTDMLADIGRLCFGGRICLYLQCALALL